MLTAILAISLQYRFGHTLATEAASILYTTAAVGAAQELRSVGVQTRNMVELLVEYPEISDGASKGAKIRTFTTVLQQNALFCGIHLGRAADRPYKKAKPVSVAIDILHKMVLDQHLDKDCLSRLFEVRFT
jgi:hypothetical protein